MDSEECTPVNINELLDELNCEENEAAILKELVHGAKTELTEAAKQEALSVVAENEPSEKANLEANGFNALTTVSGSLFNLTLRYLELHKQHKWSGYYITSPSNGFFISDTFDQAAIAKEGCKAALVYHGYHGGIKCGWLLAWWNSKTHGLRVYAECGPRSNYDYINWQRISDILDNTAVSTCIHTDATTGAKVMSTIYGVLGVAIVGATFI